MCCKKNSLLITESEKTYIKNLYGLLTEDITGEDQITLTADSTFGPGKYSQLSPSGMEELNAGIKEASLKIKGLLYLFKLLQVNRK